MGTITTSLVVQFNQGEGNSILTAEVDSSPNGLNSGETQFVPGDSPGFLIYKTSNVVIDSITPSAGTISTVGSAFTTEPITEYLTYTDSKIQSTNKPILGSFSSKWLGNDLGAVTHTESTVAAANSGVGILKVDYYSFHYQYRLTGVPLTLAGETSFPVVIYIVGHTV